MKKIRKLTDIDEGELFCIWLHNRLIKRNKNVLGAELGDTGSGKSYRDLRKVELWYKYYFKEKFPTKNICFGVLAIMRRIKSGELRRGDILIFEEAGAELGSLDFQNRTSKMFSYVLQSFRSMNIGIFFNLPHLSMMNKTARTLLHYSFESAGIDYNLKLSICKPFFHQVNQGTGKIYKKYMRTKVSGKRRTIKRFYFKLPSEYLINAYEAKKIQYLTETTESYTAELEKIEEDMRIKLGRKELTDNQLEVFNLTCEGMTQTEIAKLKGKSPQTICETLKTIKKHGYKIKIDENTKKNKEINVKTQLEAPFNIT